MTVENGNQPVNRYRCFTWTGCAVFPEDASGIFHRSHYDVLIRGGHGKRPKQCEIQLLLRVRVPRPQQACAQQNLPGPQRALNAVHSPRERHSLKSDPEDEWNGPMRLMHKP